MTNGDQNKFLQLNYLTYTLTFTNVIMTLIYEKI